MMGTKTNTKELQGEKTTFFDVLYLLNDFGLLEGGPDAGSKGTWCRLVPLLRPLEAGRKLFRYMFGCLEPP